MPTYTLLAETIGSDQLSTFSRQKTATHLYFGAAENGAAGPEAT